PIGKSYSQWPDLLLKRFEIEILHHPYYLQSQGCILIVQVKDFFVKWIVRAKLPGWRFIEDNGRRVGREAARKESSCYHLQVKHIRVFVISIIHAHDVILIGVGCLEHRSIVHAGERVVCKAGLLDAGEAVNRVPERLSVILQAPGIADDKHIVLVHTQVALLHILELEVYRCRENDQEDGNTELKDHQGAADAFRFHSGAKFALQYLYRFERRKVEGGVAS